LTFLRYLMYHQLQVTLILVSLAQSVHELTPPDVLTPIIRKLAQEFVHPGVGAEVIAAGINAIREVCRRQSWCMEEDLLSDLVEYRKSKDKGVTTAARGLLQLFREVNPGMLKRRERVSHHLVCASHADRVREKPRAWVTPRIRLQLMVIPDRLHLVSRVSRYVLPLDRETMLISSQLLDEHFAAMRKEANGGASDGSDVDMEDGDVDDEDGWGNNWEAESDDSDASSSGWQDVASDGEELDISDSDDEGEKQTRKERKTIRKRKERSVESGEDSDADEEKQTRKQRRTIQKSREKTGESDDDDTKSVVSMAPSVAPSAATTDVSQTTKKLSLLAQQKVCRGLQSGC
jgi:protein SDA1